MMCSEQGSGQTPDLADSCESKLNRETAAGPLCIRWDNLKCHGDCGICGAHVKPEWGYQVFVNGSGAVVCDDCVKEREPWLLALLNLVSAACAVRAIAPQEDIEPYMLESLRPRNPNGQAVKFITVAT